MRDTSTASPAPHCRQRRVGIAGGEAEVVPSLGGEGARVERVDADALAAEVLFGEPQPLDPRDAGYGGEPCTHRLRDGGFDPARGGGRRHHQVGPHLTSHEIEDRFLEAARQGAGHEHQAEAEGEHAAGERELVGQPCQAVGGESAGDAEPCAQRREQAGAGAPGDPHERTDQGHVGGERGEVAAPARVEAHLRRQARTDQQQRPGKDAGCGPPSAARRLRGRAHGGQRRDAGRRARRQQRRGQRRPEARYRAERQNVWRHVERAGKALQRQDQRGRLGDAVDQQARQQQAERDADGGAEHAQQHRLAHDQTEHVPSLGSDAAQEPELLPARRHAGGDGAGRDEDRGEQRESRQAGEQSAVRSQDALDLLAAPPGRHRFESRRQDRGDGAGRGLDVGLGREGDVDLIDPPLAPEDHLGADDVEEQQVAAEGPSDAARRQDAAYGEGLHPHRRTEPQLRADVRVDAVCEDVGEDHAGGIDEEGEGIVDHVLATAHQAERLDGVAVGDVGGEDREGLAGGRAVHHEERVGEDRHRVRDAPHAPDGVGDLLGKRPAAPHLQRGGAGQVLDRVA